MFIEVKPVIDYGVRGLCRKPYYNHPKGCPNFKKKDYCPPFAPLFDKYFDMSQPIYVIYNIFNFKEHVNKMRDKHPNWSEHQVKCLLYWQGTARKQLKIHIKEFLKKHENYIITTCPEAMGVNLTETMKSVGIELEWPPINFTYQIAIAGIRR